jgi:DNA polymerase-3 subunit delta'
LTDLPAPVAKAGTFGLASWAKELASTARTVEHPYNPGLMLESLASRAKIALNSK